LLRDEIRIADARMARIDPRRRPYYRPTDRMAILELKGLCFMAHLGGSLTTSTLAAWRISAKPLVNTGLRSWIRYLFLKLGDQP
jgi:hypothetical protein